MTSAELERIRGRLDGSKDNSDQEGITFWRAMYAKDVGALIGSICPVEKVLTPELGRPIDPTPLSLHDKIGSIIADALLVKGHSESGLVIDQVSEALVYLAKANDCLLRALGKEA